MINAIELNIEESIKIERKGFWLFLKIDKDSFFNLEEEKPNTIVFEELEKSLRGNGEYLIFTCSCGIADCGGWDKLKVEHKTDIISWSFNFNDKEYYYEFSSELYQKEIKKIREEIDNFNIKLEPQFIIDPE